jgi:hypothetical protein
MQPLDNPVSVQRFQSADLQNQHVERSLEKLRIGSCIMPSHTRYAESGYLECQGIVFAPAECWVSSRVTRTLHLTLHAVSVGHFSGIPTIRPLEFQMGKPFGVTRELLLDRHRELPRAGIWGATGTSRLLRREAGGDWDCEDSTCWRDDRCAAGGEEQRPGVTVKSRTCGGACY